MATSRVRHRGQPPRDVDHGPSNGAGGVTTLGAHAQVARIAQAEASRLVEVGGRMPDGGAGKIERSMATEAQRAAWRAAEAAAPVVRAPVKAKLEVDGAHAKGSAEERAVASKARQLDYRARQGIDRPAMGSPEHLHASRMRGAARHLEVVASARVLATVTGPTVTARTIEEEPVMPSKPLPLASTSLEGLRAIAAAVEEAIAAHENYHAAGARLAAAEQAVDEAWARASGFPVAAVPEPVREEERPNGARYVPTAVSEAANFITGSIPDDPDDDAPEIVTRRPEAPVEPAGEPGKTAAETRRAAAAAGGGSGTEADPARPDPRSDRRATRTGQGDRIGARRGQGRRQRPAAPARSTTPPDDRDARRPAGVVREVLDGGRLR